MKLKKFEIDHFRSIEHIEVNFPENCPVILFGPNNVGKSNVLAALDCMLGEKYATYVEFQDSDYYFRDRDKNSQISFTASFNNDFYSGNKYNPPATKLCFSTNVEFEGKKENIFHYPKGNNDGRKIFLDNKDRQKCQFVLIDATRDIGRQLSYYSQYSMLSKMARKMHSVIVRSVKDELDKNFGNLKDIFELVPEYKKFLDSLYSNFDGNVNGFEHKLEIDLSAYDPNNYFSSLRIIAKEGKSTRAFEEFGTGEQQILLMSFVKAYAETFKGETFILGIEEPEAHLHPLAQKWLAKNIGLMCDSGVQVIITTHSPEFLEINKLEGFVKVYKDNSTTRVIQVSAEELVNKCLELGSNPDKTTKNSILNFYKLNTFYDQLRGFFSRKIILVEGPTELFSLPNYFLNYGVDLIKEGVEIIDCRGKDQILRNLRLFSSFEYECYCLFDADGKEKNNAEINSQFGKIFGFNSEEMDVNSSNFTSVSFKRLHCGYFGKDYESYLRANLLDYSDKESKTLGGKVLKAKIVSETNSGYKPSFIKKIVEALELDEKNEKVKTERKNDIDDPETEIPF